MKQTLLLILICMITSCSSYRGMMGADSNIKKVNLGMTQQEVIAIMGDTYEIISTKEGTSTLGYKSSDNGIYKLLFIDGKLKEWNKEWFNDRYIIKDESGKVSTPTSDNWAKKSHLDAHRNAMLSTASSQAERDGINAHMDAHEKLVIGN